MKKQGRSMIEVKVAFWTDDLDGRPKQCRSSGTVSLSANARHGIAAGKANFDSIAGIGPAIESVLAKAGVTVHASTKAKAYAQTRGRRGEKLIA